MPEFSIPGRFVGSSVSENTAYALARQGSNIYTNLFQFAGQERTGSNVHTFDFYCFQSGWEFDLSGINPLWGITAVALYARAGGTANLHTNFTLEARSYDWGIDYTASDFISGANLGAYPLLASQYISAAITYLEFSLGTTDALANIIRSTPRPTTLKVILSSEKHRLGSAPTDPERIRFDSMRMVVTYFDRAVYKAFSTRTAFSVTMPKKQVEIATRTHVMMSVRPFTRKPRPDHATILNAQGEPLAVLRGNITTVDRLGASDSLDMRTPITYMGADGRTVDTPSLITRAWYVDYAGKRYTIRSRPRSYPDQSLEIHALGVDTELEDFLTNYGQIPLSMPSHTPTEIAQAILSGEPLHYWYNGDFAQLDETGWPVGWDRSSAEAWRWTDAPGDEVIESTQGYVSATSWGVTHTAGAQIKIMIDTWVSVGFSGDLIARLSWRDAHGNETSHTDLTLTWAGGEWRTTESPDWVDVQNETCALALLIENNNSNQQVRFRSVRFVQNEDLTGWSYVGFMDTRETTVPHTDQRFQKYGDWTTGASYMLSTAVGDVLTFPFTGDRVTVHFGERTAEDRVDIKVDGALRAGAIVATGLPYEIAGLHPYRQHVLEVVVQANGGSVAGLTLSPENRIGVTWNRATVYDALRDLQTLVGGELRFDTLTRTIYHEPQAGMDLTEAGLLPWFVEGKSIISLTDDAEYSEISNVIYYGGYGDGAFQVGAVARSTLVDSETGMTSEQLYGKRRKVFTNKDTKDATSAMAEAMRIADDGAFPVRPYRMTVRDVDAAFIRPGDTVTVQHSLLGSDARQIRVLEVSRSNDSVTASLLLGERPRYTNPARQNEEYRRSLDKLLRAH